ncbi:DUF1272 domain-containing protein [Marinicella sp. S1101]|uniref:DUF1272 domain-containing protein n=1 Tax=Marinicella marina TaxID=2996016 RepID=UPI002260C1F5|nr:DUF1272 domain-containing protein [Marinicella marina]MCX7553092.1 DUF1272 domain-containing protein [Marinicella marina]MDJ1138824.1 DUF1272 domain-containing protein [Marinicella marina]
MRKQCERCEAQLNDQQRGVFICSYECTYCTDCATGTLQYKCPNCGGELVQRPTRLSIE